MKKLLTPLNTFIIIIILAIPLNLTLLFGSYNIKDNKYTSANQTRFEKTILDKSGYNIAESKENESLNLIRKLQSENTHLKWLNNQTRVAISNLAKIIVEKDKSIQLLQKTTKGQVIATNVVVQETFEPELEVSPYPEAFSRPKLVHLDLKGAPPKLDYILWFMRFIKQFGAGGLLIEYEDMFPWSGDLKVIASKHAFTIDDIKTILEVAKEENLMIIPLIQSFGHLQFLLKHKEFETLRASRSTFDSISAYNPQSVPVIKKMIDQIVELHPDIEWLHIGGDEVYNIDKCNGCAGKRKEEIFLHHMTPLLTYVKLKQLRPIIWDDMLRKWTLSFLMKIKDLATPMVWKYTDNLSGFGDLNKIPSLLFKRYGKAFGRVWVASAFKGAHAKDTNFTPVKLRVDNNFAWLQVLQKMKRFRLQTLGMVLTGWSRYWHGAPLCELLPVGIPSLAICLETLKNGGFNEKLLSDVSHTLGFQKKIHISTSISMNITFYNNDKTSFKGFDAYDLVGRFAGLNNEIKAFILQSKKLLSRKSHLTKQEVWRLQQISIQLNNFIPLLTTFEHRVPIVFNDYYESSVATEWISSKVLQCKQSVNEYIRKVQSALSSAKLK